MLANQNFIVLVQHTVAEDRQLIIFLCSDLFWDMSPFIYISSRDFKVCQLVRYIFALPVFAVGVDQFTI